MAVKVATVSPNHTSCAVHHQQRNELVPGFRSSDNSKWNIETSSMRSAHVTSIQLGRSLNRKLEISALE